MNVIKDAIELLFSLALFINAVVFIPQAIRIFREKAAKDVSLTTFLGFLLTQFAVALHAIVVADYLLLLGYLLSIITCSLVVVLILIYRNPISKSSDASGISLEGIIEQLPEHVYWKDKNCIFVNSNTNNWKDFGLKSLADYKGKNDYDILFKEQADYTRAIDEEVIRTGKPKVVEEKLVKADNTFILYLSHKVPLKNKQGEIVGLLGVSVDITDAKQYTEDRLEMLENIIAMMPGHVYWVNKEGAYLGCNDNQAKSAGLSSRKEIVGKYNKDLPWNFNSGTIPEELDKINKEVMTQGKAVLIEEPAILSDGTAAIFLSNKVPLYNSRNEIIGMVGISLDITDRKEKERLEHENEKHIITADEQARFRKIADQVAHDIRSPLTTMQMVLPHCSSLPENLRTTLNKSAIRIADIANNLLSQFSPKKHEQEPLENGEIIRQPTLISAELLEILTEKKYEYSKLSVDFISNISQSGYFAFINIDVRAFKRTVSNLINNAVDALDNKEGEIIVHLNVDNGLVKITIQDNGKGMPQAIIDKIMNAVEVTSGKKDGHGIGLTQVRDTLANNEGKLAIESTIGIGTKITLTFPKVAAAEWIAEKIELNSNDLIIILDDDDSIHGAWEARFEKDIPNITRQHFSQGEKAVEFINSLTDEEKDKVFLLTDYELLKQELHGLDVINKTKVKRSILVTSHHNNPKVRDLAKTTNTKILPKPLASEIQIILLNIDVKSSDELNTTALSKTVDLVFIDDDKTLVETFVRCMLKGKNVDIYYNPEDFLHNLYHYPKNTKILIDNEFKGYLITGLEITKQLHKDGFTNFYLYSGTSFAKDEVPSYLRVILKTDIDAVSKLIES